MTSLFCFQGVYARKIVLMTVMWTDGKAIRRFYFSCYIELLILFFCDLWIAMSKFISTVQKITMFGMKWYSIQYICQNIFFSHKQPDGLEATVDTNICMHVYYLKNRQKTWYDDTRDAWKQNFKFCHVPAEELYKINQGLTWSRVSNSVSMTTQHNFL